MMPTMSIGASKHGKQQSGGWHGRPQQTRHELGRTPFGPVSFHERVHSDLMLIRGRKREERERGKTALEWTVDP